MVERRILAFNSYKNHWKQGLKTLSAVAISKEMQRDFKIVNIKSEI